MLEGGYDLDALTNCSAEVMRELAGVGSDVREEAPTADGPGADAVAAVARHWQQQDWS
jgi:hypothetical protein